MYGRLYYKIFFVFFLFLVGCNSSNKTKTVYCILPQEWNVQPGESTIIPIGDTPVFEINTIKELINKSTHIIKAEIRDERVDCGDKNREGRDLVTINQVRIIKTIKGNLRENRNYEIYQRGGVAKNLELLNPSRLKLSIGDKVILFLQRLDSTENLTLVNPSTYILITEETNFEVISVWPNLNFTFEELYDYLLKDTNFFSH